MPEVAFLPSAGVAVRCDGTWPNGWRNWTILSPGPWGFASFVVKPDESVAKRATETLKRFKKRPNRRGSSEP